jgi:hypothetical protein
MKRPLHKVAHATCEYGASNWAQCDRARDMAYQDWQAMQQVILAYNIVRKGHALSFKKAGGLFAQLVLFIAGERDDLTDADGNPAVTLWAMRTRDAIERFKSGDLPVYNLYEPVAPAADQGGQ